jgi:O-antigen ligase
MNGVRSASAPLPLGATLRRCDTALWLLLCFFVLVLPLAEAPKNIAAACCMLLWVLRAAAAREFGGPWDRFDSAFAFMFGSAALSAWATGETGDLLGILRVLGVAWVAKRTPLAERQRMVLLSVACLALAASIAIAAVPFLQGRKMFLELPSVGHVNQSGLYIAVLACAALGWALQGLRWGPRWFAGAAASAVFFGLALLVSASRAAILAYLVFLGAALAGLLWRSQRNPLSRSLLIRVALALLAAGALVLALGKLYPNLSGSKLQPSHWVNGASLDHRVQHWRLAYDGWRQKPWLGFGPDSFHVLDPRQVCAWRAQRGEPCNTAEYSPAPHAHSLYFSTLVERGAVGVAALAFLLGLWLWSLLKDAGQGATTPLWVGSAAGLVVVAVGGLFNTTLRVEHGSLALLMLGLWLASRADAA